MEVLNIFLTKYYEIHDTAKLPIVKSWLGKRGFQFIQTLNNAEKELCKTLKGLFDMLCKNSSHNTIRHSYPSNTASSTCRIMRQEMIWVTRLRVNTTNCKYKEFDNILKEQFINVKNKEVMISEIIKELTMKRILLKLQVNI